MNANFRRTSSQIIGITEGGKHIAITFDELANVLVAIDNSHHHLHEGNLFGVSGSETINTNDVIDILLITSSPKKVHFIFKVRSTAEAHADFYEAPTKSANGVEVNPVNHNRNSSNSPTILVYTGPTITNVGTQLMEIHFGNGNNVGGEDRSEDEWILKLDTVYLFRITSEGNTNDINYQFIWYEL